MNQSPPRPSRRKPHARRATAPRRRRPKPLSQEPSAEAYVVLKELARAAKAIRAGLSAADRRRSRWT